MPPLDAFRLKACGRWLILFAALLAFSWQGIVAETHRHQTETVSRIDAGTPGSVARPTKPGAPPDSPANCPICRELAHSSLYLPPAPIVFSAPLSVSPQRVAVSALFFALGPRWHGWRSRAPPYLSRT